MGKVTESIFDGVTAVIPLAEVCYVSKFTNCIDIHFKSGCELNLIPPEQNAFLAAWCRYRAELEADTLMDFDEAQPAPSINEGVRKVTLDFRWESEAQHHIPTIEIEFEPVSPESPNDAKSWQDRDRLAAMLTPEAKP